MAPWAYFEFAFALATAIGCFALVIGEFHMIERAEEQEAWKRVKERIAGSR